MACARALGALFLLAASGLAACGEDPAAEPPRDLMALPFRVVPGGSSRATGILPALTSPVSLQGETRASFLAPVPFEVRLRVKLPPRPLLTFAVGIKPQPGGRDGSARRIKARFFVRAGESAPEREVYRRDFAAARADEWIEQWVDLRRFAGREVWLGFGQTLVAEDGAPLEAEPEPGLLPVFADLKLHDRARYRRAKGVVVISIDTLRRDHLSLYGYRRKTTPTLDALAGEAVVFEDAVSTSSWTLPAHASLLTSLYPSAHGAVNLHARLLPGLSTLQGSLQKAGFFTQAMVTHLYLGAPYGFDEGFHRHRLYSDMRAKELSDRAIGFLRARGDDDYFLFLHYYDPHWHYDPPPPFQRTFDPGYAGRATGVWWNFKGETRQTLAAQDLAHIVALYDGEIRYTDFEIERVFREMKRLELFQQSTIVMLSDHGEEFLDHGGWEHQKTLYEEQLRVPLLVKLPGNEAAGRRVSRQVRLIDVAPTLLDALGVEIPVSFQGRSLLPLLRKARGGAPESADLPEEAWAETEHTVDGSHKLALRRGRAGSKWILSLHPAAGRDLELYRLGEDPLELRNLASGKAGQAEEVGSRTDSFLSEARRLRLAGPPAPPPNLSPEELSQLRALGYVR